MQAGSPEWVDRRLAAILAADVVGYSRLMEADEEGTLARLKAYQRDLVHPKIAEHRGRIVKTTGDGMLVEFPSIVNAVRCAVEFQRDIAERNATMPAAERIEFRVGINLGDIIIDEGDIFGDGVNVAARLEALAVPGGICVSGAAHDQVRDRLDIAFADLGEQQVKNIARPVRVYALRPEGSEGAPPASLSPTAASSPPAAAPRLSIVVLPFANLSSDVDQQYFADGITEDVTTDLSRITGMFVISRSTAFTYKDKRVDAKQIGRDLGVRYVLEGSVRRSGNRVRVNTQLIDAETDAHLWAERLDGDTEDLLTLQDEVTIRIANTLRVELIAAEAARPTEHPDALDYILRGRAESFRPNSPNVYAEAISLFEHALALDPRSVEGQTQLANSLVGRVIDQMTDSAASDLERAERLVGQALAASPHNAYAHLVKGRMLQQRNRWEESVSEFETALALDRNSALALHYLAGSKLIIGSIEETIPLAEQAIRLNPRAPSIGWYYLSIGVAHLLQSRTDEAIVWLEKARSAVPAAPDIRSRLASAYALRGETARAAAELAEARRLSRDDRYSSLARLKATRYWGVPKTRALIEATYFAGLRRVGMPEE
jgi:TolB-like protein/Flp pilus assembly protein TadD